MRYLSLILVLSVLIAVIVPCNDRIEEGSLESSECFDGNCDEDHEEHKDLCSPFCTCNCCQTNVDDIALFKLHANTDVEQQTLPVNFFHSRIAFSIWEPPPFNE